MATFILPTLQLGSRGENVRKLQRYLNMLGFRVAEDSVFGPETRQAVITFQAQAGVPKDGIAGPRTWIAIESNLGMNLDLENPAPGDLPSIPEEPTSPISLAVWGLALAGVAGLLYSGRSRS